MAETKFHSSMPGTASAPLLLYNSMTKEKEVFQPKDPRMVKMYVCGITAYDFSHIGHARVYVAFDVLYRYLRHLGYDVLYVRNFTDIDDKIMRKAIKDKEDPLELSDRFCKEFIADMNDLQCLAPTLQPRVSESMDLIIDMISKIIDNDCAYVVEGDVARDVYFSVDKFPNYGRLSGLKLDDNRVGVRGDIKSRNCKHNPADFALWKAAKIDEPISWDSPWGRGRPGWHIECSAMSQHYLSHSFDIHGGGMDLKFPHHENELAQNCAACSEASISYWLHNGFVTDINEKKMSKSDGNSTTIREVFNSYHPLALRHFLMCKHYRTPIKYSISGMENSSDAVFYMYQTLQDCKDALGPFLYDTVEELTRVETKTFQMNRAARLCIDKLNNEFVSRMADDISTTTILNNAIPEALRFINSSVTALKKMKTKQQKISLVWSLINLTKDLKGILDVLGLLPPFTFVEILEQLKEKALVRAKLNEEDLQCLIKDRIEARKNKDFLKSDRIRISLAAKGIALMDMGGETIWRPAVPEV